MINAISGLAEECASIAVPGKQPLGLSRRWQLIRKHDRALIAEAAHIYRAATSANVSRPAPAVAGAPAAPD